MGKAIQEAIVKVIGMLDPSVAKTVAEANKKFSGLKAGAAVAGAAIAGATTAAVAFGKVALDSAAKFETGMSNISTLLDGDSATVNKRIAEMGDSVMDIAKKTGMATDDLSAGMYNIVSALGDSKDVANQVEVAAKAAKAGGATTNDAINLLSAVTKGYGDTSGEAWQKASDLAFVTLKLGQTSFPELAANMGKVVPIASALNISQEELFGSFATLTGVTGGTAEVATQMKAVFSGLMTPSKQLTDTISSLGYESANVMLDQLGLIGTLDKLTAACGDDTQAVAKLFSSVEAQTAILALAGSQTENWVQKTEAMSNVANATNNAFDKSTDNLQGKLDKMKQVFETFKIRVGNILIPIVTEIVDKAIPKIEAAFDTLMPVLSDVYTSAKPVIEAFANAIPAALQIAGSVISGAFSVLKTVIPPVVSVFKFLGDNISWIGPIAIGLATGIGVLTTATKINAAVTAISANGFKAWATSTKIAGAATKLFAGVQSVLNAVMAANPIGIVIAAVAALGVAFVLLYKKCEPFRNFINGIGAAIKNGFMAVVDFFKTNWQSILLFAINPFAGIAKFLYDHCEGFRNIVNNAFNAIKNIISSVSATVSNVIASLSEKFPVLGVIFQTVQAMVTPYIDGIKNAISSVKNVFTSLIDFVKNVFTGNWAGAWESVKSIFGNAFSALTGLAKAPLNAVISLVNRAIGGLNKLHVSIPDWVPGVGGKEFGINIPQIPMLATGGIATQPSICGEGGYPEYVISTDPKYREQNQKTVFEAANAIGALESASNEGASVRGLFKKFNGKGGSSTVNNGNESTAYRIEFSPVINISGNTDNARSIADEVMRVFDDYAPELADKIKAVLATAREGSYGL